MTENRRRPSAETDLDQGPQADPSLEDLRQILFGQQAARLAGELDDLERRLTDRDALITIIAPVLGDAIRRQLRDAREEMIEALYPIIGQLVVRAVSEAIRDLARTIDARMRTTYSPSAVWQRLRARLSGVSDSEMALRDSLPFEVAEIFLVHRDTGLLLRHISRDQASSPDSDLISGMLTAIRDFARQAFGRGQEGQLEEIQYGERRILIEAGRHAYLAVVIDGIEPMGFRAEMRERIIDIEHRYAQTLDHYEGDPAPFAAVDRSLNALIPVAAEQRMLSPSQKRWLAGAAGLVGMCVVATCLAGAWTWQAVRATSTPPAVAVEPTVTFTPVPSATYTATPSPSSTPTPTPMPTPTFTPAPTSSATPSPEPTPTPIVSPTPLLGLMTGNAWLRASPSSDATRLGTALEQGQSIEILAAFGDWYQVRWTLESQAEMTGWVPARWVGTIAPIPHSIVTPLPAD